MEIDHWKTKASTTLRQAQGRTESQLLEVPCPLSLASAFLAATLVLIVLLQMQRTLEAEHSKKFDDMRQQLLKRAESLTEQV